MNKLPLVTHKRKSVKHVNSTDITTESPDKARAELLFATPVTDHCWLTKPCHTGRIKNCYNFLIATL